MENGEEVNNLRFGQALEYAKIGRLISRKAWNGKNIFVFMRPSDELSVGFIVNKVKSLPESLKQYYCNLYYTDDNVPSDEVTIKFNEYLCMKAVDGTIVNGWLASQTDMLANDWFVLG